MTVEELVTGALERLKNPFPGSFYSILSISSGIFVLYQTLSVAYCLYLHPLAAFPGPLLARCSRLWYIYHLITGRLPFAVKKSHDRYGSTVRLAPDELSFTGDDAWKEIYGFKHGTGGEMPKDPQMYLNTSGGAKSIFAAPTDRHGTLRRLLSYGFSEKALRAQEPIVQQYLDLLIRRLRDLGEKGEMIDIVTWYNYFTFDVIGDLAFAQPFDCLRKSQNHPWIEYTFDVVRMQSLMRAVDYYPLFKRLFLMMIPSGTVKGFQRHLEFIKRKALHRFNLKSDRLDLMTKMAASDSGLTAEEFIASGDTILLGGSETTATLLSGLTYFLLMNPRTLKKLSSEIRTKYTSDEEIDFASVNTLEYMLACIDEASRLYPPVPGAMLRRTREGVKIDGKYVTPNTIVGIYHWAMFRNPDYFTNAEQFVPERWLGDVTYKNDNRGVVRPFSYGPRNCIGRNLAYVEMRLTLARLLFNFDIEPTRHINGWLDQNVFLLWEKKPLLVKLVPRDVR